MPEEYYKFMDEPRILPIDGKPLGATRFHFAGGFNVQNGGESDADDMDNHGPLVGVVLGVTRRRRSRMRHVSGFPVTSDNSEHLRGWVTRSTGTTHIHTCFARSCVYMENPIRTVGSLARERVGRSP